MTLRQIEEKYGLPCQVKIPIIKVDSLGKEIKTRHIERNILRRSNRREDWYIQADPANPNKGEFEMCYDEQTAKQYFNDLEFIKKLGNNENRR